MTDFQSKVINTIEEQIAVQFTGKVNVLARFNRQFLGHILFKNGDLVQVMFNGQIGVKAFYHLIIQEYSLQSFDYIVEPELVDDKDRKIHYPYAVLKNKLANIISEYSASLKLRPPENIRILIDSEFLEDNIPVTPEEFDVLSTLSEWNSPSDLYKYCPLLDHEITMSLVSLRKKGALKILAPRA
jgi:hypothetical protein